MASGDPAGHDALMRPRPGNTLARLLVTLLLKVEGSTLLLSGLTLSLTPSLAVSLAVLLAPVPDSKLDRTPPLGMAVACGWPVRAARLDALADISRCAPPA